MEGDENLPGTEEEEQLVLSTLGAGKEFFLAPTDKIIIYSLDKKELGSIARVPTKGLSADVCHKYSLTGADEELIWGPQNVGNRFFEVGIIAGGPVNIWPTNPLVELGYIWSEDYDPDEELPNIVLRETLLPPPTLPKPVPVKDDIDLAPFLAITQPNQSPTLQNLYSLDYMGDTLSTDWRMNFYNEERRFCFSLKRNPIRNADEKTFTLTFVSGDKMLLSLPHIFIAGGIRLEVNNDEEIAAKALGEKACYYDFQEVPKFPDRFCLEESLQKPLIVWWQEYGLLDDECLAIETTEGGASKILARIYKVPHCQQWILRAPNGQVVQRLGPNNFKARCPELLGPDVFFGVKNGKLRVKGHSGISAGIQKYAQPLQIPFGGYDTYNAEDPQFMSVLINGGRNAEVASFTWLGVQTAKNLNEDTAVADHDTLAWLDGLGSNYHPALGTHYLGETLLGNRSDNFRADMYRLKDASRSFNQAVLKALRKTSDAVMAAIRLAGDDFSTAVMGDCEGVLIRDGEYIYQTRDDSAYDYAVRRGRPVDRRTYYTGKDRKAVVNWVCANEPVELDVPRIVRRGRKPRRGTPELKSGDVFVGWSDGMKPPQNFDLARAIQSGTARSIAEKIIEAKIASNQIGYELIPIGDGQFPDPIESDLHNHDNNTLVVYVHD